MLRLRLINLVSKTRDLKYFKRIEHGYDNDDNYTSTVEL